MYTYLKGLILSLLTFFIPIKGLLLAIGVAVLADTIYGIYTSVTLKGWKSFSSTKLFNVAVKTFFYAGAICCVYLIDKFIIEDDLIFGIDKLSSKIVTIIFIYIELKSIEENAIKLGKQGFIVTIKSILKIFKDVKKDLNQIKE